MSELIQTDTVVKCMQAKKNNKKILKKCIQLLVILYLFLKSTVDRNYKKNK